ncbi:ABC transporter substrate-binding protein [Caulobacter soli]|uniref:ABC transporter substrate-binding protein n=1 Tax=Caulobacter soli TaxID=2708539 RepID=UPI0013EAC34E|nr:ABC transporter substrate-binding protein [Caulobacter soli]
MKISWTVLAGALLLSSPANAEAMAPSPVVIGQLVSRTGNNPGGLENEQGAALAAAEINAHGGILNGRRIELRLEDDQTNPQGAIDAFARLERQDVAAVVGSSFSNASLAAIPSVEAARIPYVSTGAAEAQIRPVRPYVFITPLTGRLVGEQLLRYMKAQRLTRIVVVYDADSLFGRTGWAIQKEKLARYGIEVLEAHAVHVDTKDFSPILQGVATARPQAVMAWLTGPPAIAFAQAYGKSPRRPPLLMPHGVAGPAFVNAVGADANGIIVAAPLATVAADLPKGATKTMTAGMVAAFIRAHGHAPSQFALDGYVAVKLIAAAIEKAGSDDPAAIRNALEGMVLPTPQGQYRYTANDHSGLSIDDVAIAQIIQGQFRLTPWSAAELERAARSKEAKPK